MRRSLLFLPGNTPNMLINGSCLGADAVIFDLEDAVSPGEKDAARILVRNTMTYMDFRGCEKVVRINGIDTPYWREDLDEILPCRPDLILLPKTGSASDIREADAYIAQVEERLGLVPGSVGLVALIVVLAVGVKLVFAGLEAAIPQQGSSSVSSQETSTGGSGYQDASGGLEAPKYCPFCGEEILR